MRRMQQLQPGAKATLMTSTFYGYNHRPIIADGELYDMLNLSGDNSPLLTLRKKRGVTSYDVEGENPVKLTGIHGRDQLVFIRGSQVFYNFIPISGLTVSTAEEMLPKKIVSMGAYVCIWPDKVYINTANLSDYGSMEKYWSDSGSNISMIMCRSDGEDFDMSNIDRGETAPENPTNGQLWLDEGGMNDVLRQYMASVQEWMEINTVFVKIHATGIGANLKEYDVINISGLELGGNDPDAKLYGQIQELNGAKIIYACGDDYIVLAGILSQAVQTGELANNTVTADLTLPDMDYVVESNNRLWGCKYGMVGGEVVNEIYASALGSFKVWRRVLNNSQDSYTAQVGTDGPFTGAITQRGYPVFFKENCIHRISGLTPNNFQIQTTFCRGVQEGSWRSLAIVAENIYYKARDAVMVYDGNMPQAVSDAMGEELYSDARAGVLGDKYYICMKDKDDNFIQFVLDTKTGSWWKENSVQALGYGTVEDELYFIDEVNNTLVSVRGTFGEPEEDLEWSAIFDLYGVHYRQSSNYDDPKRVRNMKYVSMFKIRMELGQDAWVNLYMQYNGGDFELAGQRSGENLKTFVLPIVPKRCDHVRFRLEGQGNVTIYDISRIMEVGGDG